MKVLLRVVENACVALYQASDDSDPELLPTRYDLYQYRGGVAWGYKGAEVMNLAVAIAARYNENIRDVNFGVFYPAILIAANLLCNLNQNHNHDISLAQVTKILK